MSEWKNYIQQAYHLEPSHEGKTGVVGWTSPSNIALVKYWGKKPVQLPINPSLSMSLSQAVTETTVHWDAVGAENSGVTVHFNGQPAPAFRPKVVAFINRITQSMPFLGSLQLQIDTHNSFPHSAGIASSASAMSALALCFLQIEMQLFRLQYTRKEFLQKASYLARLGSGSAARSVYPGFVLWGETPEVEISTDQWAVPVDAIHPLFQDLRDSILITSSQPKKISSTQGHETMNDHPFRQNRVAQAMQNINILRTALKAGDWETFAAVTEEEALGLHGLMLSARQGFSLLNDHSLAIIDELRAFRKQQQVPLTFTLDAGPNVHVLYPADYETRVHAFLHDELSGYLENGQMIHDFAGQGPEMLTQYGNHGEK